MIIVSSSGILRLGGNEVIACKQERKEKTMAGQAVADLLSTLNTLLGGLRVGRLDSGTWIGTDRIGITLLRLPDPTRPSTHRIDLELTVLDDLPVTSVAILVREEQTGQVLRTAGLHKSRERPGEFWAIIDKLPPTMAFKLEVIEAAK